MTMTHDLTESTLLRTLGDLLESEEYTEGVVESDRAGRMALSNVKALQDLGVVGLPASTRFGDAGPTLALSLAVMELIGRHDASSAVAINMNWSGVRGLKQLPSFPRRDEALTALRANRGAVCGAFSIPAAELDSRKARLSCRIRDGEVVLNGRAGFGSMSDAATHAMLGATVDGSDPADPAFVLTLGRFGEPGLIKHDNWSAMGMRGTGSNDIECRDLRIPVAECLVAPVSQFKQRRTGDSAATALGIAASGSDFRKRRWTSPSNTFTIGTGTWRKVHSTRRQRSTGLMKHGRKLASATWITGSAPGGNSWARSLLGWTPVKTCPPETWSAHCFTCAE